MAIPLWLAMLPLNLITEICDIRRIEKELIAAIVSIESNGNSNATRYEPRFRWLYKPAEFARRNYITEGTERTHQRTSWGLMQVMGSVAREKFYNGPLNKLNDPRLGLNYGIDHLLGFIDKYDSLEDAISAYNQGGNYKKEDGTFKNQAYVDKIMKKYTYLKNL